MSMGERIDHETLVRLIDSGERPEVKGAGAWDGIQIADLALDLRRARAQRDRFQARANHLRILIARTVTSARLVLYEIAGREIQSERIVTLRMKNLIGRGSKPQRRGIGGPKRKEVA